MRTIAIYLIFLFSNFLLHAQYRKMPLDTNHYWQQRWGRVGNFPTDFKDCSGTFKVRRDTLINGKVFKLVESRDAFCYQSTFGRSSIIIRDDTIKKLVTFIEGQQEKILFNFNKNVGDTAIMLSYFGMDTVTILQRTVFYLTTASITSDYFFLSKLKMLLSRASADLAVCLLFGPLILNSIPNYFVLAKSVRGPQFIIARVWVLAVPT